MGNRVIIEMEKLSDIACGLGQVCLQLGQIFEEIAPKDLDLEYMVFPGQISEFGEKARYHTLKKIYKTLPFLSPKTDLWHSIHQDTKYFPPSKKIPFLLTINDLNFLQEERDSKTIENRIKILQKKVDRSCALTVISKYTEKIVREHLRVGDTEIHQIYLGVNLLQDTTSVERPSFLSDRPFLFTVGTILPKKNFHVLVQMMKHLKDFDLVIAGSTYHPYASEISEEVVKNGLEKRVFLPGKISEQMKSWYYQNASAFVFPSLAEGFGIPAVEAMGQGIPTILSTEMSLPEIGGVHADYFKNFDPADMAFVVLNAIDKIQKGSEESLQMVKWSEQFNWRSTAESYLELYRKYLP
ncbi:MAG: glycosyltransferase family 4 protein [Bacteriovoracaceae bacterium]|jgi:glycosyltransferase involved in cell wall biosynthesis|nr:glycosyltransferase family 4 protein [Bacteriovoracaceae bacterium]